MHTMAKMGLSIPLKMLKKKKLEKESPETLTQIIKSQCKFTYKTNVIDKYFSCDVCGSKDSAFVCGGC